MEVDHRVVTGCMQPGLEVQGEAWKRIYFELSGMGNTKGADWIANSDDRGSAPRHARRCKTRPALCSTLPREETLLEALVLEEQALFDCFTVDQTEGNWAGLEMRW